jgi:LTXXQ motif family protein
VLIRAPLAAFYDQLTDAQKAQFVTATALPDPRAGRDAAARMCGMSKLDVPMRQAERTLHPSGAQRASFENLQKKSFEMGQFLLASCLQPIPSTPTARLDASSNRLTAVIFATSHISVALNDFYNQLSPEQKTKFNSFVQ